MTHSDGKSPHGRQTVDFTSLIGVARSRIGSAFYAAYRSECCACGIVINEGDLAGYADDEVVCEDCHADARSAINLD